MQHPHQLYDDFSYNYSQQLNVDPNGIQYNHYSNGMGQISHAYYETESNKFKISSNSTNNSTTNSHQKSIDSTYLDDVELMYADYFDDDFLQTILSKEQYPGSSQSSSLKYSYPLQSFPFPSSSSSSPLTLSGHLHDEYFDKTQEMPKRAIEFGNSPNNFRFVSKSLAFSVVEVLIKTC